MFNGRPSSHYILVGIFIFILIVGIISSFKIYNVTKDMAIIASTNLKTQWIQKLQIQERQYLNLFWFRKVQKSNYRNLP